MDWINEPDKISEPQTNGLGPCLGVLCGKYHCRFILPVCQRKALPR